MSGSPMADDQSGISHNGKEPHWSFDTQAIHGGYCPKQGELSTAVPLYQTAAYHFEDTLHAANLFALREPGHIYSRLDNPTNEVLEKRIALLEGGVGALALASGLSAITTTVLTLAKAGDEIVSSSELYGGCYSLFAHTLKRFGITVKFVPSYDLDAWESAITDKTKLLYTETIGNPKLHLADIRRIANIGNKYGIPLVVDNTMTTPYLLRPIEHGAAIVIHSATKYIGGHGTSMGGLIIDSGKFNWEASGRFPDFVNPEPSYHGLRFWETFGPQTFIVRARALTLRDTGAVMSPFNAWLFIQGLETLGLRMQRHCENALAVARYLEKHPAVSWINYPGLESFPTYPLNATYLPHGHGAMIGFGLKGGKQAGQRFIESVKVFSHVANLGDSKSLVIHPASTTHSQLNEREQENAGVTPDFIRMSVGIENISDLLHDLEQALSNASMKSNAVTPAIKTDQQDTALQSL